MDKNTELALQAKNSPHIRNSFIQENRNFILKISSLICKRQLDWANDDELSVALLAFNEAIDSYDRSSGKEFLNYAKIVIRNRLVDYFRKESKCTHISLESDEDSEISTYTLKKSMELYQIETENQNMTFEVMAFSEILSRYGITIEDLTSNSPTHRKTRFQLMNLALLISQHPQMVEKFKRNKQLPAKDICAIIKTNKRLLERWRKYIVAMLAVLTHDELSGLRSYIFSERRGK